MGRMSDPEWQRDQIAAGWRALLSKWQPACACGLSCWPNAHAYEGGKVAKVYGFFNPQQHVVAGTPMVIAQVMVQADFRDQAGLEQSNRLTWPKHTHPACRLGAEVIKEDLHGDSSSRTINGLKKL